MDQEDREHFKTIAAASVVRLDAKQSRESNSRQDLAYFQAKADAICGCYRRDEAQNPETFAAALTLVLADYPKEIAEYAADPRTGIVTQYPLGLPNIGQIKEFCDGVQTRQDRIERYSKLKPMPRQKVPKKEGQFTYGEFLEWAEKHGKPARPVGRFEQY
jgi:hypothetical protein